MSSHMFNVQVNHSKNSKAPIDEISHLLSPWILVTFWAWPVLVANKQQFGYSFAKEVEQEWGQKLPRSKDFRPAPRP